MTKKITSAIDTHKPSSFADEKKFTVADLTLELGKSEKTIRKWIHTRKLKAYRIGREFIITASQLNEFAEACLLKNITFGAFAARRIADPWAPWPVKVELEELSDDELLSANISASEWYDLRDLVAASLDQ